MHHTLSLTPPSTTACMAPIAHMAHMAGQSITYSSMIVLLLPDAGDLTRTRPQPARMLLFSAQSDSSEMSELKLNKSSHILRQPCVGCLSFEDALAF